MIKGEDDSFSPQVWCPSEATNPSCLLSHWGNHASIVPWPMQFGKNKIDAVSREGIVGWNRPHYRFRGGCAEQGVSGLPVWVPPARIQHCGLQRRSEATHISVLVIADNFELGVEQQNAIL